MRLARIISHQDIIRRDWDRWESPLRTSDSSQPLSLEPQRSCFDLSLSDTRVASMKETRMTWKNAGWLVPVTPVDRRRQPCACLAILRARAISYRTISRWSRPQIRVPPWPSASTRRELPDELLRFSSARAVSRARSGRGMRDRKTDVWNANESALIPNQARFSESFPS